MKYLIIFSLFLVSCAKDICQTCTTKIETTNTQGYYDIRNQESYVCNEEIQQLKDMDGTKTTTSGGVVITQKIKTSCK